MAKQTKGSFTYRGHVVNFRTTEKDGRWICSARFHSSKGGFGMSDEGSSSFDGFPTKEEAEKATLDMVKKWIDRYQPDSPTASPAPAPV